MPQPLILDQSALAAFVTCPRRFQLRYLLQAPWPSSPLDSQQNQAVERGRAFHRLVEQHLHGVAVSADLIADPVVRGWWRSFQTDGPAKAGGRLFPEHRLTVPASSSFLAGRFDLLVVNQDADHPSLAIYDWKTSSPRTAEALRSEWQTRLYLALAAEGSSAFLPPDRTLSPEDISLSYWYPTDPDAAVELQYNSEWHQENWAQILSLVTDIERLNPGQVWPLTNDLQRCRSCMYQAHCGRQEAGTAPFLAEEEARYTAETALLLEPHLP
ncbi:MAG: PD-(D/E)XK nuclease family protein [Candidatus Promineifilaceae bacterium]